VFYDTLNENNVFFFELGEIRMLIKGVYIKYIALIGGFSF